MAQAVGSRRKPLLVLSGMALAMSLTFFLSMPTQAQAGLSNYCGNQVVAPAPGYCWGAQRMLNYTYAWGDDGSVCAYASTAPGAGYYAAYTCSGGPGLGTYTYLPGTFYLYPHINNNVGRNNRVHGVAHSP